MKFFSILIIAFVHSFYLFAQADTVQHVVAGRKNSIEQQKKPYVILISADGFRYDYAKKYQATTLLNLSASGVRADAMIPSFPSLTFPNHYTIATGLYPSHHGLVANNFYDAVKGPYSMSNKMEVENGSWYGGTPIWVLAEEEKMVTASFYWVGSEAPIKGVSPTYYYKYNEKINIDQRVKIVVDWLKLPPEKRPHLITFYFSEVDHESHVYGPESQETEKVVNTLDLSIKKLTDAVKTTGLPVSFIFVSDHGMALVDTLHTLPLPKAVDTSKFIIKSEGTLVQLYAKNKADIISTYTALKKEEDGFKAQLKTTMPLRLHYGQQDDVFNRIGDVLLIPEWPKVFKLTPTKKRANLGWHGYDPYKVPDMKATFFAWGPAFKKGLHIPAFENVHVYPIIVKMLGLTPKERIDGDISVLGNILK